jgi:hypothetical protein
MTTKVDGYMLRRAKLMADLIDNPIKPWEKEKVVKLSQRYGLKRRTVFRAALLSTQSNAALAEYLLRKNWKRAVFKID